MKKLILIGLMCFVGLVGNHASGQKVSTQERQRTLYRQAMDLYGKQKYAAAQQIFDEIAQGTADRADLTTADACYFAGVCSEKLDNNDAYYRLFVTEYLYNTSEEIIGAKVKYQKPFCGRDEALKTETKDLSFTAEGGTEKVFFKNSSIVPFTVSNSQSWCQVQRISSSDNAFLYDGISVTTLASGLPTMSSDTITLETLYGKTHTIVVQREGHAYLEASAESLDFTAYSGSSTLMLKTNMKWEAYASDSWIEISPTSGDGNASVKVPLKLMIQARAAQVR